MHLLNLSFVLAVGKRAGTNTELAKKICTKQLIGIAGIAAERIHRALDLPGGIEGAVRTLELHPMFNPAAYVTAEFGPDVVHVRRSPAHEDGAWISLVDPGESRARCRRVSPPSTHISTWRLTGTDTDWTARVIETDTAAKELREVSVVQLQRRLDVRVRAEEVASADGRIARADPPPQVVAQFVAATRRTTGVDDERLDDPQQVLGELVEISVGIAEAGPVDIEAPQHRVGEVACATSRRHRLGVRVRPAGIDEQAEVLVLGQPLERGRDRPPRRPRRDR